MKGRENLQNILRCIGEYGEMFGVILMKRYLKIMEIIFCEKCSAGQGKVHASV